MDFFYRPLGRRDFLKFLFFITVPAGITACAAPTRRSEFFQDTCPEITETPPQKGPADCQKTEQLQPRRLELISNIPEGGYKDIKIGSRPTSAPEKNTFKALEEEMARGGQFSPTRSAAFNHLQTELALNTAISQNRQTLFVFPLWHVINMQNGNGKWVTGWAPPGIYLAQYTQDPQTGIEQYSLIRREYCKNPVSGLNIRVVPAVLTIRETCRETASVVRTERYHDKEVVTETVLDRRAAVIAGIAGFIIGGIVGFLLAPHKKVAEAVVAPAFFKGPGAPAF